MSQIIKVTRPFVGGQFEGQVAMHGPGGFVFFMQCFFKKGELELAEFYMPFVSHNFTSVLECEAELRRHMLMAANQMNADAKLPNSYF